MLGVKFSDRDKIICVKTSKKCQAVKFSDRRPLPRAITLSHSFSSIALPTPLLRCVAQWERFAAWLGVAVAGPVDACRVRATVGILVTDGVEVAVEVAVAITA
jgi:hypothetical protein